MPGVTDFSYAGEFDFIYCSCKSPSRVNCARVKAGFLRSSDSSPYVAPLTSLSLFIHSLIHSHIILNRPAKLPLNAPQDRAPLRYFIAVVTSSNNLNQSFLTLPPSLSFKNSAHIASVCCVSTSEQTVKFCLKQY